MRAFASSVILTSFSAFASCQSSGVKGTIIIRQHCGTPVGTPSLWIQPTHYVSNATAHISTTSAQSGQGQQNGGTSHAATNTRPSNVLDLSSSTRRSATIESGSGSRSTEHTATSSQVQTDSNISPALSMQRSTTSQTPLRSTTTSQVSCLTATATPITCPASDGITYTPAGSCIGGQDSYVIDCGMEYSGGGLTILAGVANTEQCIDSCNNDEYCMAVAFDTSSSMCYERSSVVFGNATAMPNLIFAFNARYVAANGVYPSSGVDAVPSGLTKTLSSISSDSIPHSSPTAAQATSTNPTQSAPSLNPAAPGTGASMSQPTGRSQNINTISTSPFGTGSPQSLILPVPLTGAVSLASQTGTSRSFRQSTTLPGIASQQGTLPSSASITTSPSATATVPVSQACPQEADKNIMVPEGTSWTVNCAQLYVGELVDMGTNATSSLTADDCLATCDRLGSGCAGFTYTHSTCMMYSRIDGVRSAAASIVSARRFVQGTFSSALTTFSASTSSAASSLPVANQGQSSTGDTSLSASGASGTALLSSLSGLSLTLLSSLLPTSLGNSGTASLSSISTPNIVTNSQSASSTGSQSNSGSANGSQAGSSIAPASGLSNQTNVIPQSVVSTGTIMSVSELVLASNSVSQTGLSLNTLSTSVSLSITPPAQSPTTFPASSTIQIITSVSPTQAAPCPSANGQTYTDQNGTQYMIMCSTDTYPGNFAAAVGIGFDQCVENCARQTEQPCVAITYTNNTCFYKSQYDSSYPVGNVQAAVRLNLVTGTRSTSVVASTTLTLGASGSLTAPASLSSSASSISALPSLQTSGMSLSTSSMSNTKSLSTPTLFSLPSTVPSSTASSFSGNSRNTATSLSSPIASSNSNSGSQGATSTLVNGLSTSSFSSMSGVSISGPNSGLTSGPTVSVGTLGGLEASNASPGSLTDKPSSETGSVTLSGSNTGRSQASTSRSISDSLTSIIQSSIGSGGFSGLVPTSTSSGNNGMASSSIPVSGATSFNSGSLSSNTGPGLSSPTVTSTSAPGVSVVSPQLVSNGVSTTLAQSSILGQASVSSLNPAVASTNSANSGLVSTSGNTLSSLTTPLVLGPNFGGPLQAVSTSTLTSNSGGTSSTSTLAASNTIPPSSPSAQASGTSNQPLGGTTSISNIGGTATTVVGSVGSFSGAPNSMNQASTSSTSVLNSGSAGSNLGSLLSTSNSLNSGAAPTSTSSSVLASPSTTAILTSSGTNINSASAGGVASVSSIVTSVSAQGGTSSSTSMSSALANPGGSSSSGSSSYSAPNSPTIIVTDPLLSTTSTSATISPTSVSGSGLPNQSVSTITSSSVASTLTNTNPAQSGATAISSSQSTPIATNSLSTLSTSSPGGQGGTTTSSSSQTIGRVASTSSITSSTSIRSSTTVSAPSSTRTTCAPIPTAPTCPGENQTIYQALDGSRFRLDCGIDYPGLDVDAYAAADLQTCFDICEARGPTCAGVSFVPSYLTTLVSGYTCYFKNSINVAAAVQQTYQTNSLVRLSIGSTLASGSAPACPGANGQDYIGADGSRFRIHCNTDYPNNGLIQANASSFQVCIDACDRTGILCAGVSFTPAGNGISSQPICYLKSAIGMGVNAVLGLVGGVIGSRNYDVHSAVRIGNPIFNNPPAYTCSAG